MNQQRQGGSSQVALKPQDKQVGRISEKNGKIKVNGVKLSNLDEPKELYMMQDYQEFRQFQMFKRKYKDFMQLERSIMFSSSKVSQSSLSPTLQGETV